MFRWFFYRFCGVGSPLSHGLPRKRALLFFGERRQLSFGQNEFRTKRTLVCCASVREQLWILWKPCQQKLVLQVLRRVLEDASCLCDAHSAVEHHCNSRLFFRPTDFFSSVFFLGRQFCQCLCQLLRRVGLCLLASRVSRCRRFFAASQRRLRCMYTSGAGRV